MFFWSYQGSTETDLRRPYIPINFKILLIVMYDGRLGTLLMDARITTPKIGIIRMEHVQDYFDLMEMFHSIIVSE